MKGNAGGVGKLVRTDHHTGTVGAEIAWGRRQDERTVVADGRPQEDLHVAPFEREGHVHRGLVATGQAAHRIAAAVDEFPRGGERAQPAGGELAPAVPEQVDDARVHSVGDVQWAGG